MRHGGTGDRLATGVRGTLDSTRQKVRMASLAPAPTHLLREAGKTSTGDRRKEKAERKYMATQFALLKERFGAKAEQSRRRGRKLKAAVAKNNELAAQLAAAVARIAVLEEEAALAGGTAHPRLGDEENCAAMMTAGCDDCVDGAAELKARLAKVEAQLEEAIVAKTKLVEKAPLRRSKRLRVATARPVERISGPIQI